MFIGNEEEYTELKEWLEGTRDPDQFVCIVSGPTGCGKSFGIGAALAATGKMVTLLDTSTCLNGKDFKDKYTKTTQSNIMAQFSKVCDRDRVIFIDELDAMLSIDRTFLSNIKNLSDTIKVVVACTPETVKRVSIPHKSIVLHAASDKAIHKFLNRKKSTVVSKCNGNISTAIRTMKVDHVDRMDHYPDIGTIYRSTSNVYSILSADPWLNTLRFHENLVHEFKQRKQGNSRRVYTDMMLDLCQWDVMMTSENTEYAMQFISNSVRKLEELPLKKTAAPPGTQFTRLINQLSIRKKGIVSMYNSDSAERTTFPWHQVGSFEKHNVSVHKK